MSGYLDSHTLLYSPENKMTRNSALTRLDRPVHDEISRLFESFEPFFSNPYSNGFTSRSSLVVRPVKTEESFAIVEIETPGIDPSDIKVQIEGKSLTVETPRGNAYVTIGQRLKAEEATASLKHGLMTIRIPKRDSQIVKVEVHEE